MSHVTRHMFYTEHKKKIWFGGALGAAIGLYLFVFNVSENLSPEFFAAREAASLTSGKIVTLANLTSVRIAKIQVSDADTDVDTTLALIRGARDSNSDAYAQAFALSRHLQKITETLREIRSRKSQQLAYEAVSVELGLISELMAYTERLNRFLEGLAKAVAVPSDTNKQNINQYLKEVNEKVATINKLNKEFLRRMRVFDESL